MDRLACDGSMEIRTLLRWSQIHVGSTMYVLYQASSHHDGNLLLEVQKNTIQFVFLASPADGKV